MPFFGISRFSCASKKNKYAISLAGRGMLVYNQNDKQWHFLTAWNKSISYNMYVTVI